MPDQPFERVVQNTRESLVSDDWNRQASQLDRTMREVLLQLLTTRISTSNEGPNYRHGFIGQGFRPVASSPAGMSVVLKSGLGFFYDASSVPSDIAPGSGPGATGIDDLSAWKPMWLAGDLTIPGVPAADATNPRRDIIEVKYRRALVDTSSRLILDTSSGARLPDSVPKTLSWLLQSSDVSVNGSGAINYKSGTPAGSPAAPTVTSGYVKIGEVYVPATDTAIDENQVADFRPLALPYGVGEVLLVYEQDWTSTAITLHRLVAPPGVRVAVKAASSGAKRVTLWVLGSFDHASMHSTVMDLTTIAADTALWSVGGGPHAGPSNPGGAFTIDSTDQTALTTASPALNVALNQPALKFTVTPNKQISGTTGQPVSGSSIIAVSVRFSVL